MRQPNGGEGGEQVEPIVAANRAKMFEGSKASGIDKDGASVKKSSLVAREIYKERASAQHALPKNLPAHVLAVMSYSR